MGLLKGGKSPSSEALLPVNAGEKTASGTHPTADNQQRPASVRRLACARRTVVVLSLCALVLLWLASVGTIRMPCHQVSQDHQTSGEVLESSSFSMMLKSASPTSLHDLLNRYFPEKFPHGVFPSAHQTAEVVEQAGDAPLATSNVQLAKRQSDNSTTSGESATPTTTPTGTSTPPSATSSSTTVPPPSTSSSSQSSSSVAPPSTSSVPPATTSRSSSSAPASTTSSSLRGTSSSLSEITSSPTSSSGPGTSSSSTPQTLPSSSVAGGTWACVLLARSPMFGVFLSI